MPEHRGRLHRCCARSIGHAHLPAGLCTDQQRQGAKRDGAKRLKLRPVTIFAGGRGCDAGEFFGRWPNQRACFLTRPKHEPVYKPVRNLTVTNDSGRGAGSIGSTGAQAEASVPRRFGCRRSMTRGQQRAFRFPANGSRPAPRRLSRLIRAGWWWELSMAVKESIRRSKRLQGHQPRCQDPGRTALRTIRCCTSCS